MKTYQLRSHVKDDGLLRIEVPIGTSNRDVEVLVVVTPTETRSTWPHGFFERTYGALHDEPLERPSQGEFEEREPLA